MAATAVKRRSASTTNHGWADSTEVWSKKKYHDVVLPSGMKVTVQAVDIGQLALANLVPEDLQELARKEFENPAGVSGGLAEELAGLGDTEEDFERARKATATFAKMMRWLVAEHIVIAPKITVEDLAGDMLPMEDLDWLYSFAVRRVDTDALGRRLGVARLDDFATFRDEHGCGEDCEACSRVQAALSTADMGEM